jgi:hypothetical protein
MFPSAPAKPARQYTDLLIAGGIAVAIAQKSPYSLVALLSAAVFLVRTVFMMMGPLLVALAAAFDTSVAATGQLAAAIGISWGLLRRSSARCLTPTEDGGWGWPGWC